MSAFEHDGCTLHYTVDDFTDRWRAADTVLFVHGLAESGETWRPFVPHFGRDFRVIRLDLRGYGRSTPMAADYAWRFDTLVADVAAFCAHVSQGALHLVGCKIGGTIAMAVAARHPDLVKALCAVGAPAVLADVAGQTPAWIEKITADGVRAWAAATQRGRMGGAMPESALDYWSDLMGKTAASTLQGFLRMVPSVDVRSELGIIRCPTLILTTSGSGLGSVAEVRSWQETIPSSELQVIEADSYHVAASHPDEVARRVLQFIQRA